MLFSTQSVLSFIFAKYKAEQTHGEFGRYNINMVVYCISVQH